MFWTPEDETRLRSMWATHSTPNIARALGKSKSAVIGKGHRLGLYRPPRGPKGFKMVAVALPDVLRSAILADADARNITHGSVVREIIAKHYRIKTPDLIAERGGARPGAGRKPAKVRHTPSMPSVPMARG